MDSDVFDYRYNRVNGVVTDSTWERSAIAECNDCVWSHRNHTLAAARKNAHRHIVKTDHTVSVVQVRIYTYAKQTEPKA